MSDDAAGESGILTPDVLRRAADKIRDGIPCGAPLAFPPITLEDARAAREVLDEAGLIQQLPYVVNRAQQTARTAAEVARVMVTKHREMLDQIVKASGVPVEFLQGPPPVVTERRRTILDTAEDAGSDFVYYDRKEDEDLPVGALQDAVRTGEVTRQEIADAFLRGMGNDWGEGKPQ